MWPLGGLEGKRVGHTRGGVGTKGIWALGSTSTVLIGPASSKFCLLVTFPGKTSSIYRGGHIPSPPHWWLPLWPHFRSPGPRKGPLTIWSLLSRRTLLVNFSGIWHLSPIFLPPRTKTCEVLWSEFQVSRVDECVSFINVWISVKKINC